jgi:uncharacterized membrane protein
MNLLDFLKPIHILAGTITLISGTVAIASKKGQPTHRLAGKIFFWAMTVTCALGLNAGIFKPEYHLFIPIALISYYQAASGYRILYIKNLHTGQKPELVDWILSIGMFITASCFIVMGIMNLGTDPMYAIVLFAFSTIGLYCCIVDFYHYFKKPTNKYYWLFIHIFRMSHAFIAAITALLVNNGGRIFPSCNQLLLLILPIGIGQPIITWYLWSRRKNTEKAKTLADRAII